MEALLSLLPDADLAQPLRADLFMIPPVPPLLGDPPTHYGLVFQKRGRPTTRMQGTCDDNGGDSGGETERA